MVALGPPAESARFKTVEVNGITIYYPPNLQIKEGFPCISVRLRKLVLFGWLELEGAKAIAIYN